MTFNLIYDFFSPEDYEVYPPNGMYNLAHFIFLFVSFISIVTALFFTIRLSVENIKKMIQISSIIFVVLEIAKIIYNFSYGYFDLLQWLPLSFCSLFIYAQLMAGFGKGLIEKLGYAYIVGGGIIGGIGFLLVPTTSLMLHPAFHFLSFHSVLFHTVMVYLGILCLLKKMFKPTLMNYKYYFVFALSFIVLDLFLNIIFDTNLMIIMKPFNIPIPIINNLYDFSPIFYTFCAIVCYLIIYVVPLAIYNLVNLIKNKKRTNLVEQD